MTRKNYKMLSFGTAVESDAEFIKQLSRNVFSVYGQYEEVIASWFRTDIGMTIVAREENVPTGFAMLGKTDNSYDQFSSELLAIAVAPSRQGIRIGESLMRGIDNIAVNAEIKRIFLHTATDNLRAQKLFARVGYRFIEIRKSFYPNGQDAYVMSKETDFLNL